MTVPANPWMALIIGFAAVMSWLFIFGFVWALLYAHGEREAQYIPVEADR